MIAALLRRLFAAKPATDVRIVDLGDMRSPVYAIGDVHGCKDLLRQAVTAIGQDAAELGAQPIIVLLGDTIDRGPDSAGVLDEVENSSLLAVLGNHERMMLTFLANPHAAWDWLQQGGYETLRSYGLALSPAQRPPQRRLHQMLAAHIPDAHVSRLNGLPHGYRFLMDGRSHVLVHAGLDPTRPLDRQRESALLWGRDVAPHPDHHVVQGHIVVAEPRLSENISQIDTGAVTTGVLTVLRLAPGLPLKSISVHKDVAERATPPDVP